MLSMAKRPPVAISRHMLRDAGYRVRVFSSGKAFLEAAPALVAGCVVLDICRSGAGGLAIPRELKARRIGLPVIVLGDAQGDVTFVVQVMKAGAVDFLPVPYGSDQLLAAVASAAASTREDEQNQEADRARLRIAEMSEREREVLAGLLAGKTNKEIGRDIGLSPRTVETHRAHVMQRLGVQTLSQAVLVATSARIPLAQPRAEHVAGLRLVRNLIAWQKGPAHIAVFVGRAEGRRSIQQNGISLRDHPQTFPTPQTFNAHRPDDHPSETCPIA